MTFKTLKDIFKSAEVPTTMAAAEKEILDRSNLLSERDNKIAALTEEVKNTSQTYATEKEILVKTHTDEVAKIKADAVKDKTELTTNFESRISVLAKELEDTKASVDRQVAAKLAGTVGSTVPPTSPVKADIGDERKNRYVITFNK